jgi:phosphohistidine phosphatase
MLTLSLFRHGKSSWNSPSVRDIDRPLSERGEAAVPRMGAYMVAHKIAPELVLCSPAVRARQTLDLLLPHLGSDPTVVYEDGFYLASSSVLLKRVRQIESKMHHVMIVGHDPGLHGLALAVSGEGHPEELQALSAKFPTAGLAVIVFKARDWSGVKEGAGRLTRFITPRRLP